MAAAAAMLAAASPRPGSSPRPQMRRTPRTSHAVVKVTSDDAAGNAQYTQIPSDDPDSMVPIVRRSSTRRMTTPFRVASWRIQGMVFLDSIQFQCVMAALIILNAILIGLETDLPSFEDWDLIEDVFLACFALELAFKMAVLGPQEYFKGSDNVWNSFDFAIVSLGVLDLFGSFIGRPSGGFATLFRVVRLLRILRIFRIVRFLKELYLLAFGFVEAAKAVFWVTILMTFMLYVCAVLLVRTLGHLDPSADHAHFLNEHFGSVLVSMWSLFELMASPNLPDYTAQQGLLYEHPLFALFLVSFVIFGSFGMIALLTGVISESMFQKNQLRLEADRLEQERMHNDVIEQCEELFDTLGRGNETELPRELIVGLLPTLRGMLDSCGVDYTDRELETMTNLMDVDHSGTITKKEFVNGISRIVLGVRPVPIQEIAFEVSHCKKGIDAMTRDLRAIRRLIAQSGIDAQSTDAVKNEFAQLHFRTLETASREQLAVITDVNMNLEEMRNDLRKQLQELRTSTMLRTQAAQVQFQGRCDAVASGGSETSTYVQERGLAGRSFTLSDLPAFPLDESPGRRSRSPMSASNRGSSASDTTRAQPTLLGCAQGTKATQEGSVKNAAGRMPRIDHAPDRGHAETTSLGEVRVHDCPPDPQAEGPRVPWALPSPKKEVEGLECASAPLLPHEMSMMSSRAAEPSELPNFGASFEPEEIASERYSQSCHAASSSANEAADQSTSQTGSFVLQLAESLQPHRHPPCDANDRVA